MSEPKEPGFFLAPGQQTYYPTDTDWYLGLFESSKNHRYRGESSTHYTKLPTLDGVAERIRERSPDARLLYVVRDPVDRLVSHYWHKVHRDGEAREFSDALKENPEYLAFGDYHAQLQPYVKAFGRDAIKVVVFEQLRDRPTETMIDVWGWLDLDANGIEIQNEAFNKAPPKVERQKWGGLGYRIRTSSWYSKLAPLIPKGLRQTAAKASRQSINKDNPLTDELLTEAIHHYRERNLALQREFEVDVSGWRQ